MKNQGNIDGLVYFPGISTSIETVGRYCDILSVPEVQDLQEGMDFRRPEYRREVFLRFYEKHLEIKAHPGIVYLLMPYLYKKYAWSNEARLWFAYINGHTQNPVMSKIIFDEFPDLYKANLDQMEKWFNENWARLDFDSDRKYQKKDFIKAVRSYRGMVGNNYYSQSEYFGELLQGKTEYENWNIAWEEIRDKFYTFGRLSAFSYMEYLRIMRVPIDCPELYLEDMSGSKSHRNGLAKVLGRDDWDWHQSNPSFNGKYTPGMLEFLKKEGEILLNEAKVRFKGKPYARDVSYVTLESTFCNYKGWHRKNRRYCGVYLDMHYNRIKKAETLWPNVSFQDHWDARATLPSYYLLEENEADPGVKAEKQNHYRETGQVIMMDSWPCFRNGFNAKRAKSQNEVY